MEETIRSGLAAIHPFWIAGEVWNWLGIARRVVHPKNFLGGGPGHLPSFC